MNELEKCMAGEYYDCHDLVFLVLHPIRNQTNGLSGVLERERKTLCFGVHISTKSITLNLNFHHFFKPKHSAAPCILF